MDAIKSTLRRRILFAGLMALAACAAPALAQQAAYPSKPIHVVVPYPPHGTADTVARLVTAKLSDQLKTPIIIDNQPGANGQTGSAAVARSAPDGYTLLVGLAAHVINGHIYSRMPYTPLLDLRGVSEIGAIPLLMASSAQLPPNNLKAFVAWVKAHPQKATFASSGTGAGAYLTAELFAYAIDTPIKSVPYAGIALALPDLLSGRVAATFDSVRVLMPHVKAGKLHALAITSATRWPAAPSVPTMAELGLPDMTGNSWIGILAPVKTPNAIVNKLAAQMQQALDSPEIHAKLIEYGIDPIGGTPQQFDDFIQDEARRWGKVVKETRFGVR